MSFVCFKTKTVFVCTLETQTVLVRGSCVPNRGNGELGFGSSWIMESWGLGLVGVMESWGFGGKCFDHYKTFNCQDALQSLAR